MVLVAACSERVTFGPGVKAPHTPSQGATETEQTLEVGTFTLSPRATYSIKAKLLSKRRYRFDTLAELIPWDFALGWGALSDESQLRGTRVTQGDRKMYWHLSDAPLDLPMVEKSSANTHLIPATPQVRATLEKAPTGAIITLEGQLVDVMHEDGRITSTSLTRDDVGVGACEILWVERVVVETPSPT